VPFAAIANDDKVKQRGVPWRIRRKFRLASARHPRRYCQRHAPRGPLSEKMTSSTKPEVHNVLHCGQRRSEPRQRLTRKENFVKFGHVVFEICERTDIQTRQSQYLAPLERGEVMSELEVLRRSAAVVWCGQADGQLKYA